MKSIVLITLALVAVAVAAPTEEVVEILQSEYDLQPSGGYKYGYKASNGIAFEQYGRLQEALDEENKPHTVVVVKGSYSYPKEDGTLETIEYIADENGFHPRGDSIPKNPDQQISN